MKLEIKEGDDINSHQLDLIVDAKAKIEEYCP